MPPVQNHSLAHESRVLLTLRLGAALCFIGHGAFGIITKQAWVPYFGVVGLPESWAWRLMPWVGSMDVAIGFMALYRPCRALWVWAAFWATWTALLRPLAGQGWSEFFERGGNYGVPIAILTIVGLGSPWFARLPDPCEPFKATAKSKLAWVLRIAVFSLLAGHAGCALLIQKASLAKHYAILFPTGTTEAMLVGGAIDGILALAMLLRPSASLAFTVGIWKLACEALFLGSGTVAPMFEVIERGGSYVIPFVYASLLGPSLTAGTRSKEPVSVSA